MTENGRWRVGDLVCPISTKGDLLTPTPVRVTAVHLHEQDGQLYYQVQGTNTSYPEDQLQAPAQGTSATVNEKEEVRRHVCQTIHGRLKKRGDKPRVYECPYNDHGSEGKDFYFDPETGKVGGCQGKHTGKLSRWVDLAQHLGIDVSQIARDVSQRKNGAWRVVATYPYRDADGELLFEVVRKENGTGKKFTQRRPDGSGGYVYNLDGTERVLYRLPELLGTDPDTIMFVVEGEKDADRLLSMGIPATCSPHGAEKWASHQANYNGALRGRRVCIIPDNDEPGRRHALQVIDGIKDLAAEVRVLELPDLPEKGDVSTWLDNGGEPFDLVALAGNAPTAEEWLATQQPEPAAKGWTWRTLADAYKPKEPRRYVVAGQLPIPSLTITYGPPGTLKTMLELDRAICVAGGVPWLPPLDDDPNTAAFEVLESPVLWLDVDNGLDLTERRLAAIGKGHNVPQDAPLAYVSFPTPPFVASCNESVDMVLEAVQQTGARLVVFDNLGTISGGADENSSQMVAVMSGLRQIAESGQCAVIVLHHETKGSHNRAGNTLRGHSSIEGSINLALRVYREEDANDVTLRSTKSRDLPVSPFSALWVYEHDDAGELTTGGFWGLGRPEVDAFTKAEQAELCVLTDMKDGMNQRELVDLIKANAGIGRHTALGAIQKLVGNGKLQTKQGPNNAIIYEKAS